MPSEDEAKAISSARKRRGVSRGSITRLATRVGDLEGLSDDPTVLTRANQMVKSLQGHDADFKNHHLALIDLLDNDEELEKEQRTLDDHEETVSNLLVRLNGIISANTVRTDPEPRKVESRRLARIKKNLSPRQDG